MLEQKIADLIQTIQENTAALIQLRGPQASVSDKAATEATKVKVKAKTDQAPVTPPAEVAADKAPATDTGPAKITIVDIRDAAQKVLDAGGIAHIRPLLGKYGVTKISAAPEARYSEVLADLTAALSQSTAGGVV